MPYHKCHENCYLDNPYTISGEHDVKNTPTVLIRDDYDDDDGDDDDDDDDDENNNVHMF
jgi:hypothetical protein